MDLSIALLLYLLILVVLTFIFYKVMRKNLFSSLVLGLIISLLFLVILFPPTRDELDDMDSYTGIYFLILFGTFFVIFSYIVFMTMGDSQPETEYFTH
jgi:magnesium-transporting ATPase (P-type)